MVGCLDVVAAVLHPCIPFSSKGIDRGPYLKVVDGNPSEIALYNGFGHALRRQQ